jgi:7-keto-8-aminopelargonate synthetase-like enzyme
VHFRTASLAKAFAGRAGFITCSSHFKGYFLSESRPAIFSSCLLGHELAWFDAAIDFIAAADDRRAALHAHARREELARWATTSATAASRSSRWSRGRSRRRWRCASCWSSTACMAPCSARRPRRRTVHWCG